MKYYIDFDGVICDTVNNLLKGYYELEKNGTDLTIEQYVHDFDWHQLLLDSPIINDAINYIKNSSYDVSILTRVHSLNEGRSKIEMLRLCDLKNDIILVPAYVQKSEVVIPNGNVLVDDQLKNLNDWHDHGGISIFFNQNGIDIDEHGEINSFFKNVSSLQFLNVENNKTLSRTR